jgi:DNA-binding NarL/FixJ family response regulator
MENIRVLIVDDLPQVRQELANVLRLASRNVGGRIELVGEAQNGSEAIEQSRRLHPDVVLMDLEMPILDGFEATRRIKLHRPAPRVVILSIHDGPEERERARAAGADDFVAKGVGVEVLLSAILPKGGAPISIDLEKGEKE